MRTLSRPAALSVAIACLAPLAAPATTALANHENYGNNAVVCYIKTRDYIRCFHAGPLGAMP